MTIPYFLRGFAKPKPTPIQKGDRCRDKDTGVYSECLTASNGMYFGGLDNYQLTMGKLTNFEKV